MYKAPDFVKVSTKMNDVFATYHSKCENFGGGFAVNGSDPTCEFGEKQYYLDIPAQVANCISNLT